MIRRACLAAGVLAVVIAVSTTSAVAGSIWPSRSTALSSTRGWFEAINHHNRHRLLSYVAPGATDQMGWADPRTKWSTFTRLRCRLLPRSDRRHAVVYCSFRESRSPSEGNPDSFWDVFLRHTTSGWLITGYGQG
jgi:hypothetical protein